MRSYTIIKLIRMTQYWAPWGVLLHQMKQLRREKSKRQQKPRLPRVDVIQGELLKYGGEEVIEILQDICNKILKTGICPEDWTTSMLISIPKKASRKCADHRAVAL